MTVFHKRGTGSAFACGEEKIDCRPDGTVLVRYSRYQWRHVTCKRCLKARKKK